MPPATPDAPPQVPPEVLRYLQGPPAESKQFDFLLGAWDVDATRYKEDGTPALQYRGSWTAVALNGGRMVMDDFQALAPDGRPVSSFVTLRTYCDATRRWEMAGLQALQPALPTAWHGSAVGEEMHLDATATLPNGQRVQTRIRFHDITADAFAWESSMSLDAGGTWRRSASLVARRRAGSAGA